MDIDKALVRKHFDRHAHEYDGYASVQDDMAGKLMDILGDKRLTNVQRILEIGSGTGMLTRRLCSSYPQANLTVVDLSSSMLERLRHNLGDSADRTNFILGDIEDPVISEKLSDCANREGKFDLIVSSAAFQWLNDPRAVISSNLPLLDYEGLYAFATFGPQTFYELKTSFLLAEQELGLPAIPHGQSFRCGEEWRSYFPHQGEADFLWQEELRVERFPSVKEFLLSVKKVGAGNASRDDADHSKSRMAGRKLFAAMEDVYKQRFSSDLGIEATYHLVLGCYESI
jgi:malonyl-CoA O-methyltransferase